MSPASACLASYSQVSPKRTAVYTYRPYMHPSTQLPGRKTQANLPTPPPLKHLRANTQTGSIRPATPRIALPTTAEYDYGTRDTRKATFVPHAEQTTPRATHTPAEAWKRDLTEEGIEPNPGPSRFITKNLGSIGELPRCADGSKYS